MALAAWEGFWFTDFIRDIYRYLTIYSLSIFVSLILLTWAYILAQFLVVGIVFFSHIFCTVFILLFFCFAVFSFVVVVFIVVVFLVSRELSSLRSILKLIIFLPKRFLQVAQFFYEIVEKKRGSYDTLTYTYIWSENIVHMNLSYELTEQIKRKNRLSHFIVDYWVGPSMLITLLPLLLWCCGGKFSIYATHWMIVPQNTEIYITLENSENISNGSLSRIASTISKTVKIYPRTRRKLTYIFCSASRRRFCKF